MIVSIDIYRGNCYTCWNISYNRCTAVFLIIKNWEAPSYTFNWVSYYNEIHDWRNHGAALGDIQ